MRLKEFRTLEKMLGRPPKSKDVRKERQGKKDLLKSINFETLSN